MAKPVPEALLDSNVLVAAVTATHVHHTASAALFAEGSAGRWAVAAHSHAEAYNTLTKRSGPDPLGRSPADARKAVSGVAAVTVLVGLTPAQTLTAIERFADGGGVGARLFDFLIGEAARQAGLRRVITWNVGHFRGLFTDLRVLTPADALA